MHRRESGQLLWDLLIVALGAATIVAVFPRPASAQLQCTNPTDHWSWNFNLNCPDGWTFANVTASCVPGASGYLKLVPTSSDPQAISASSICFGPSAHDYMRIEIRSANANSEFQLFFRNGLHDFNGTNTKIWNINTDGNWHYYTFPLSGSHPTLGNVPGWFSSGTNGNISRLRLDPARSSNGEIHYGGAWVRRDDKPPSTPVIDNVSQSGNIVSLTVHGDDPPPTFSNGTNPDLYGSGVYDFGWSVDAPAGPQNYVVNSSNDVFTGRANGTVAVDLSTLGAGCHTVYIWSRDRCGWVSTNFASRQIVGLPFSITASAGANGAISPSGSVSVNCGDTRTFTMTPNSCYRVASVLVDNVPVGAVTSYTFADVQANHTIVASFTAASGYTITASAGPDGTISPSGSIGVACGGNKSFNISASSCHVISDVRIDGNSIGAVSSYTFTDVQSDHTISCSFTLNGSLLPPVPSGLKVTNLGTASSLQVSWQPVAGALSYALTRTGGAGFKQITTSQTSYADVGLPRNVSCSYTIAATNSCGTGAASAQVSRAPDYFPVLLVHGLCGGSKDFTDGSASCFPGCGTPSSTRLGDVLYRRGLGRLYLVSYDINARAYTDVAQLRSAIDNVLAQTGDPRVVLVGHSMGGLISRSLLQTIPAYRAKVASVIMIGTPNHGSALANGSIIQLPFLTCLLGSQARMDLVPGSAFLNQLNYGGDKSRYDKLILGNCLSHASEDVASETNSGQVSEWNLMGTGGWCGITGFYVQGLVGCWPNDGVVANADTRLTALASTHQRTDVALDPAGTHRRTTHFHRSEGSCNQEELTSPTIADAVYQVVTSGTPTEPNQFTPPAFPTIQSDPDTEMVALLQSGAAHVEGGSTWPDTVMVDPTAQLSFLQSADLSTGLKLALQSPSGVTYAATDTITGAVTLERDPDGQFQAMAIANPEPGRWIALSSLPVGAEAQDVYLQSAINSQVVLALQIDDSAVQPGATEHVVTSIDASGIPSPSASLHCAVLAPDATTSDVPLYDDGYHDDGAPLDGNFGGAFPIQAPGQYSVIVQGRLTTPTGTITRTAEAVVTAEPLPDPAFTPGDLVVHPRADGMSQDSLLIAITVHNLGSVPATGALVTVGEPGLETVAELPIDLPAGGDLVLPELLWHPSNSDTATLVLTVSTQSNFLESRLDNDAIVATFNPTRIVSVAPSNARPSFELATGAPNPTTGKALIRFTLPNRGRATLRLYDVQGRNLRTLVDGMQEAGPHSIVWDGKIGSGTLAASGVYFCELAFGSRRLVRRIALIE